MESRRQAGHLALTKNVFVCGAVEMTLQGKRKLQTVPFFHGKVFRFLEIEMALMPYVCETPYTVSKEMPWTKALVVDYGKNVMPVRCGSLTSL